MPARVSVEELSWAAGRVRARLVSPVAQRLTVRSPYGERDVDLVAATPVEVAFAARG